MTININFKYTEDANGKDPDIHSAQLREDLLYLYRKELPNGVLFDIQKGKDITDDYLVWNGWRFSSDSITNTYTHQKNYQWMIQELVVGQALPDTNILFNYFKGFMLMQLNL